MPTRFTLPVPADYLLHRDACSYGYFLLAPNGWTPETRTFRRVLELEDGAATLRLTQPASAPGLPLRVTADRGLSRHEAAAAKVLLTRMLRLDEDAAAIRSFHRADRRFRRPGRGRLMRSPTFFEDVVKTVTSCNVAWPSTVTMNERLCRVLGRPSPSGPCSFPTPARLARVRPATLRARCRVGYRDARLIALAKMFLRAEIDPTWYEDPATPDAAIYDALLELLPGIGPYAAANIMQLLGRYGRLPLDTESVRHAKAVLGWEGTDRALMQRMHAHYAPFGEHAFRSYWFELWAFYESRRGPAETWDQETTGRTFTASQLKGA